MTQAAMNKAVPLEIPEHIRKAAAAVEIFFRVNGIEEWALMGIQSRNDGLRQERDALKVEYESRVLWIAEMNAILGYDNSDGFRSEPSPHEIARQLIKERDGLREGFDALVKGTIAAKEKSNAQLQLAKAILVKCEDAMTRNDFGSITLLPKVREALSQLNGVEKSHAENVSCDECGRLVSMCICDTDDTGKVLLTKDQHEELLRDKALLDWLEKEHHADLLLCNWGAEDTARQAIDAAMSADAKGEK